jgi:uncharacterized membrane protein
MSDVPLLGGMLLLAAATLTFKMVGPVTASGRALSPGLQRVVELLPVALIAGLLVTQTFDGGGVDAKVLGVVAAGVAVAFRAPFALVVLAGAGTAALLRALGMA